MVGRAVEVEEAADLVEQAPMPCRVMIRLFPADAGGNRFDFWSQLFRGPVGGAWLAHGCVARVRV